MSVRDATSKDSARFVELWEAMTSEIYEKYPKADSGITRKNLNYHKLIFDNYVEGFAKGLVLLWQPEASDRAEGVIMVGDKLGDGNSLDERWEYPAWIHGIYITPEYRRYGGWRALHRAGAKGLRALGFTDTLGFVPAGHAESFRMNTLSGGTPYAILMELSLGA